MKSSVALQNALVLTCIVSHSLCYGFKFTQTYAPSLVPARHQSCATQKQGKGGINNFMIPRAGKFSKLERLNASPGLDEGRSDALQVDWSAIGLYIGATSVQIGLISLFLKVADFVMEQYISNKLAKKGIVIAFFAFMSLKSRVFSPFLDNSRPSLKSEKSNRQKRKTPSWTPPPIAFPFIWLTIACLRATSSTMVWEAKNCTLLNAPVLSFMLHLSIGDTWNCINNVERRMGASVSAVILVWLSVINAVRMYWGVSKTAGLVLLPSAIWISIATVLITSIWNLNGKEPLFPVKKSIEIKQ
uniref:Tryptophan-rich sensory protein n=2 Tax=Fibrocapsa japonica TaxID=94617 RepID=A0A7S2V396_9STRA|mmetsp:Transcript_5191/g.7894  ORF Transcript_5191/g.7894 Transcript_5191/m.7894 type:complete len:301 (+) Transcript_5191:60-962(+)